MDILLDEFLKAPKVLNGRLEIGHLFGGDIAGNIPAVLVTLVVVVRALGPLADDTDSAPVHALDLGELLEDGFRSGFGIHVGVVYAINIYYGHKKGAESQK
jgi:hypothetical protein